ncbi:MAG: hypothetical protein MJ142_02875, partial [Clostridia bacterium]|nr:hypothetical protein [Clostridia bacterium]
VYTLDQFLYEHNLTEEAVIEKGREYILAHTSCSEDELKQAAFIVGTMFDDPVNPDQHRIHPTLLVILDNGDNAGIRWDMQFDMDLNIIHFEETTENING